MKIVIQRVSKASVTVNKKEIATIKKGVLILLGIVTDDTIEDINWLTNKISNLRIFNDAKGVMNASLLDVQGEALVVSQFTLHALTKKGNRPSYIKAAKPDIAIPLYNQFIKILDNQLDTTVQKGEFGADMKVELLNDGPVTILIDSKHRI